MRYCILVTGPAGSGKSTFCSALIAHAATHKRTIHLFNLDPAAEDFEYEPSVDIRDLISLEDVMEDLELGPNGGLVYCFEYLLQNIDWLQDTLGEFEDDYLVIDCPGQIELYTHIPLLPRLLSVLTGPLAFRVCRAYLLESQFASDVHKYFAGVLSGVSSMVMMEVPTVNLMSKMDMVKGHKGPEAGRSKRMKVRKREIERFLDADPELLSDEARASTNPKFHALNESIVRLIEDFNMVSFLPLDATDEDSLETVLSHIDNALQYGEHEEPREPQDVDMDGFGDEVEVEV